jgi:hypothetical protein
MDNWQSDYDKAIELFDNYCFNEAKDYIDDVLFALDGELDQHPKVLVSAAGIYSNLPLIDINPDFLVTEFKPLLIDVTEGPWRKSIDFANKALSLINNDEKDLQVEALEWIAISYRSQGNVIINNFEDCLNLGVQRLKMSKDAYKKLVLLDPCEEFKINLERLNEIIKLFED